MRLTTCSYAVAASVYAAIQITSLGTSAWAFEEFNSETYSPVFEDLSRPFASTGRLLRQEPIGDVRVLVFPHWGAYATPQGKETSIDRVSLSTESECRVYSMNNQRDPIQTGKTLVFTYSLLKNPVRVVCDSPTAVVREKTLKSFKYNGSFEVRPGKTSSGRAMVRVINIIPFEPYLKGVVPTEMPSAWPLEALKTQAVAARTYAYWEIMTARSQNPERDFDVDDTIQYQAYMGLEKAVPATNEAVEATEGQIVVHDDDVIKAYFAADSGGYTEDAEHIWGARLPYCRAKPEAYDLSLVQSSWQFTNTLGQINAKLVAAGKVSSGNPVIGIKILDSERYKSGRPIAVTLSLRNGTTKKIGNFDFRYIMKMRSNLFWIKKTGSSYLIYGKGYGHGAGMQQWGAKVLNDSLGWDYSKILEFYYDGTEICSLPGTRASGEIAACSIN